MNNEFYANRFHSIVLDTTAIYVYHIQKTHHKLKHQSWYSSGVTEVMRNDKLTTHSVYKCNKGTLYIKSFYPNRRRR